MNIEKLRLVIDNNQIALDLADDRAHRIATVAAEDAIRSSCTAGCGVDEFIAQLPLDDHLHDCIVHLCWSGEAISHEAEEDGSIIVQLGDFTR
jgi:hypothetical protein